MLAMLGLISMSSSMLSANTKAEVYYVKLEEGQKISKSPIQKYEQGQSVKQNTKVSIYPDIEFQQIEGIGGAFNEIGGVSLMSLPESGRREVMEGLFGVDGAQFSFCRTAMGSSDFGVDAYSYSEVAEDFNQKHFSIKREMTSVVPYIKMAYDINPNMMLFASPWSPPAWMKLSGYMDRGNETPDLNKLRDEERIYKAYALYMAKYVKAYDAEGIKVDRIIVQNETDISTKYPSNIMGADAMYDFVKNYLRPEFKRSKVKSEVWAGSFRTMGGFMHALEFAANPEYVKVVDGIGIQYTPGKDIADMNTLSGYKPTMHTEGKCHNGQNTVSQAFSRLSEIADYLNYGVPNYCYWNMILDHTTKSGWGWAQNSLININTESGEIVYNPDYAVMSLFGRYLQRGSVRIAMSNRDAITVKKDGVVYMFVNNTNDSDHGYNLVIDGKIVTTAVVPSMSMAVVCYKLDK